MELKGVTKMKQKEVLAELETKKSELELELKAVEKQLKSPEYAEVELVRKQMYDARVKIHKMMEEVKAEMAKHVSDDFSLYMSGHSSKNKWSEKLMDSDLTYDLRSDVSDMVWKQFYEAFKIATIPLENANDMLRSVENGLMSSKAGNAFDELNEKRRKIVSDIQWYDQRMRTLSELSAFRQWAKDDKSQKAIEAYRNERQEKVEAYFDKEIRSTLEKAKNAGMDTATKNLSDVGRLVGDIISGVNISIIDTE